MSRRTSHRLDKLLIMPALFALIMAGHALAGTPRSYAALNIAIDSGGQARYNFNLFIARPLTDAQRSSLESLLGASIKERQYPGRDSDDDGDDDYDDGDAPQPAPRPSSEIVARSEVQAPPDTNGAKPAKTAEQSRPVFLTAQWTKQLPRNGMEIEDQIEAGALLRAVIALGANTLTISVSHPKTGYSGCTEQGPARSNLYGNYSSTEFHQYFLSTPTSSGQPDAIKIAFGYTHRMLAMRAVGAGIFFLLPVILVLWRRMSASRSRTEDAAADRFAAIRLLNLISIGLPISWWVFRSVSGVRDLTRFVDSGYSRGLRTVIEIGVYALPPLLFIVICALILNPLLRRTDVDGTVKPRLFREIGGSLLRSYLPLLLSICALLEVIQGEFAVAMGLMIAGQALRMMGRSLKPGGSGYGAHALIVTQLRERVLELASRAGVRLGQIYVLPMDESKMANAFATSSNNVLLCEYLLRQMNKREVDGVVAHEISHLRLNHPRIKQITTYGSLILPLAISIVMPFISSALMLLTHSTMFLSGYMMLRTRTDLMYAGAVVISILLRLVLSRRFEYSADALAVTITRDPEAMITALVKLARLNLLPMNWSRFDENLLTHPSTMRRVRAIASRYGVPQERLQMLIDNPDTGQEFYSLTGTAPAASAQVPEVHPAPWQAPAPRPMSKHRKGKPFTLIPAQFGLLATLLCFFLTRPGHVAGDFLASYGFPVALAIAIAGAMGLILSSHLIKLKLLSVMPKKVSFVPTRPDAFPGLDLGNLAKYTDDFVALGFNPAADYTSEHENMNFSGFARLFINPSRRCFAEVNQVMAGNMAVTPMRCMILSCLGTKWSLSTTGSQPQAVLWASRLPENLVCYRPGATPTDLYREHLSQRNYIGNELGAEVSGEMSVQYYLVRSGENALKRRARLKRMNALVYLLRIDLFNRKPKTDWLGRFAKHQNKMRDGRNLELEEV